MIDGATSITGLLEVVAALDGQQIRWELKKLQAIREWALTRLGVDYQVGDRVAIATPISTDNGWAPYREALRVGATGVVTRIDFSPHHGIWLADVELDNAWSLSGPGADVKRYWKGRASETPPGFEVPSKYDQEHHPDGKRKLFMLNVNSVRRHCGAPVLVAPAVLSSASWSER